LEADVPLPPAVVGLVQNRNQRMAAFNAVEWMVSNPASTQPGILALVEEHSNLLDRPAAQA